MGSRASAARLYIDIASPDIKPIPTAVPLLKAVGEFPKSAAQPNISVTEELRKNLSVVGEFEVLDPKSYLEDSQKAPLSPSDESFAEWRILAAELLIKGQVSAAPNGDYVVELHAYDVTRRVFIFGKRYKAPPRAVNETAHMFANALMEELTGKAGPFGTEIAFVVKKGGAKNIGSIRMNGSGFRMLTQNESLNLNPVWSRDGVSIYLTSYFGGRPDLCRLHIPTRELRYVYKGEGADMPGEESPDGKTLLFAATSEGNTDIYSMELASHRAERITSNRAIDVSPAWSPDGKRFAYVSDMRGTPHIFAAEIDKLSETPVRLTFEGKHNGEPAWSPDGTKIAYTGLDENGVFQIFIVDPEGKSPVKVTTGRQDSTHPSWSPDGRFLAFSSNKGGTDAVYVLRLGVNKVWRLTPPGVDASQPVWSYGHVAQ